MRNAFYLFLFIYLFVYYFLHYENTLYSIFWGLGIGDWGLGIGPNHQSPIPKPQKYKLITKNKILIKN